MKKMSCCVIAHGGLSNLSVDDSIELFAHADWLLRHNLMRPHTLNRRITSRHLGDDGVVIVRVEPSLVANLPAGLGIERSVVENDFAGIAGLEFSRTLSVVNDCQHFATVGASLPIAFEDRFRKLLVCGIGGLLSCAFPGGPGANLLFGAGQFESLKIELNADVACGIRHEVEWQAIGFIKVESIFTRKNYVPSVFTKLKYLVL